ncbi:hypothetical protein FHW83_001704 [Duganella sp. SG902]|nr:hypothetical protein [Duganella sp. SG902]NVM75917.1 hypothetical protein [Duganella sp. SG902]
MHAIRQDAINDQIVRVHQQFARVGFTANMTNFRKDGKYAGFPFDLVEQFIRIRRAVNGDAPANPDQVIDRSRAPEHWSRLRHFI